VGSTRSARKPRLLTDSYISSVGVKVRHLKELDD
jgi:hypothetical protein